jgi:hypothetical protein
LVAILLAFSFLGAVPALAAKQQMQSSPSLLKFGTVVINHSETQLITLTNTGSTKVTISAINANVAEFTVTGVKLPFKLAAGESTNVNIIFTPSKAEYVGGTVTFTSDASNADLKLSVGGTGAKTVGLTSAPSSLSFGPIAVGSKQTLTVVVTNTSLVKVTLSKVSALGAGFSVSEPKLPLVLTKGQSFKLNVTFTAESGGVSGGSISIPGAASIPLTGNGTTTGQLTIAPSTTKFGSVDVGSKATQSFNLTATGASVKVTSVSSSNAHFTISGPSFPLTIAAGKTAAVDVVFAPSNSGSATGTLTLNSNADNSKATESVSGTGIDPKYSVDLSWLSSTSPVSGYNVYRGTAKGKYSKVNGKLNPSTTFTDTTVASGSTYYYAVTAVNSSGEESSYSTPLEVAVP